MNNDKLIKQERLVHELFLRHVYDKTNGHKLAAYNQAKQDLISLKYAGVK